MEMLNQAKQIIQGHINELKFKLESFLEKNDYMQIVSFI